jgi:hypothetical protein
MTEKNYILSFLLIIFVGISALETLAQTKKPTPKPTVKVKETATPKTSAPDNRDAKSNEKLSVISEGRGIEGIVVGKSTKKDVEKKFGTEYRWDKHKKYSYQMTYYRRGVSFYICQSDPQQKVFVIEIRAPYKAKTSKGIILGKSTVEDIQKKYGKSKSGLEYRGINFYYNRVGNKKIVSNIDIVENSGIRQCKVSKK